MSFSHGLYPVHLMIFWSLLYNTDQLSLLQPWCHSLPATMRQSPHPLHREKLSIRKDCSIQLLVVYLLALLFRDSSSRINPSPVSAFKRLYNACRMPVISKDEAREALLSFVGEHCCYGKGAAKDMDIEDRIATAAFHVCFPLVIKFQGCPFKPVDFCRCSTLWSLSVRGGAQPGPPSPIRGSL